MIPTTPFKRLILRAILRQVSPMVIRLLSVPDHLEPPNFMKSCVPLSRWI